MKISHTHTTKVLSRFKQDITNIQVKAFFYWAKSVGGDLQNKIYNKGYYIKVISSQFLYISINSLRNFQSTYINVWTYGNDPTCMPPVCFGEDHFLQPLTIS